MQTFTPSVGQVFAFEGSEFPESQGWSRDSVNYPCERWLDETGHLVHWTAINENPYAQRQDWYRRSLVELADAPSFFMEWRLETNGDQAAIPSGAPAGITASGSMGIQYHFTIARDQARLIDPYLNVILFEIEPDVAHTFRLEVRGLVWTVQIDGQTVNAGIAYRTYPTSDSVIVFGSRAPGDPDPAITRWDHVRYGVIPDDAGPGDLNCDGTINPFDIVPFVSALSDADRYGRDHPACQQKLADIDENGSVNQFDIPAFIDLLIQ